jgi:stearoyl-CoA desaturase (Delta-9 desaturase)
MKSKENQIIWKSVLVLIGLPVLTLIVVPWYGVTCGYTTADWFWFGFFMVACGISVTAGYHRLWSHKAYQTNIVYRLFFLIFGTATLENSVIKWSSDHRKHHRFLDDPKKDPYAATRGFFFSHMGWMFKETTENLDDDSDVNDLKKDKLLAFQHRHYTPLAVAACFLLPFLIGATYGDAVGCFLLAGLLRMVIIHHFTFFINSLAHFSGKRTYDAGSTPRDNPLVSLVTFGEGYHSFHHKFAGDYRNGVNWYDFDPSKWLISLSEKCGIAKNLKRTPKAMIVRAKLTAQYKSIQENQTAQKKLDLTQSSTEHLWGSIEMQYKKYAEAISAWGKAKQEIIIAKKEKLNRAQITSLKVHYKNLKRDFRIQKENWDQLIYKQAT